MGVQRMIMLLFEAVRRQAYQIALIIDATFEGPAQAIFWRRRQ